MINDTRRTQKQENLDNDFILTHQLIYGAIL